MASIKSDIFIRLDSPETIPSENSFLIQGWIISHSEITNMWISGNSIVQLEFVERPDVVDAYPSYSYVNGFQAMADLSVLKDNTIPFFYLSKGKEFSYTVVLRDLYPLSEEKKKEKLDRIAPYLACPHCGASGDRFANKKLLFMQNHACAQCGRVFQYNGKNFNFLSEKIKLKYKIIDTENVSSNCYDADPIAVSLIEKKSEGLILDCGAGKRLVDYPNVINFEIVDYPSTDVIGIGERLPFQDNTFDAAFSFTVLEHVTDPFSCAKELVRVLKKKGTLYCIVPFLQPTHGYPNHYYNMTTQGLQNIFDRDLEIIEVGVPQSGIPIWTLSWFLNSYSSGLDDRTRQEFLNMRVGDFIVSPNHYLQKDFVMKLPKEKQFELACTTMIVGNKK